MSATTTTEQRRGDRPRLGPVTVCNTDLPGGGICEREAVGDSMTAMTEDGFVFDGIRWMCRPCFARVYDGGDS